MILSKATILQAFNDGHWKSNIPLDQLNIGPNSIDVTLNENILIPNVLTNRLTIVDPFVDEGDPKMNNSNTFYEAIEADKLYCNSIIHDDGFLLHGYSSPSHGISSRFILGSVNEKFDCSTPIFVDGKQRLFVPMYEGRSTVARLGIQSHISAGFGDYGFKGSFTLEIMNNSPWIINLRKNIRIGQVYFIEVDDGVKDYPKYSGYDQSDCLPAAPRLGSGRF